MASLESAHADMDVSTNDILFECPSCRKSLVVDETAEGMIIECPQCHINVIVPPRAGEAPDPAPEPAVSNDAQARLAAIAGKLKELQTQRTEINNRLAARMNEVNRDVVMMARLEASHQQVLRELAELTSQIAGNTGRTRVNLQS